MANETVTEVENFPDLYTAAAETWNRMDRQIDLVLYGIQQGRLHSALRATKAMRASLDRAVKMIELEMANGN